MEALVYGSVKTESSFGGKTCPFAASRWGWQGMLSSAHRGCGARGLITSQFIDRMDHAVVRERGTGLLDEFQSGRVVRVDDRDPFLLGVPLGCCRDQERALRVTVDNRGCGRLISERPTPRSSRRRGAPGPRRRRSLARAWHHRLRGTSSRSRRGCALLRPDLRHLRRLRARVGRDRAPRRCFRPRTRAGQGRRGTGRLLRGRRSTAGEVFPLAAGHAAGSARATPPRKVSGEPFSGTFEPGSRWACRGQSRHGRP